MAQIDDVHTVPAFLGGNITIQGWKFLDTYIQAIEEVLAIQPQ
jgi:predicted DsbA family dithiol-disulfide isomerase